MGIPVRCEGANTIAELNPDRRGLGTVLRLAPTGQKAFLAAENGVDQSYRHLTDQLANCCADAPPPTPPGAALTGTSALVALCHFVPGLGASRGWALSRRVLGSASYVGRSGALACGM
jgi:hypothetical protein